MEASHSPQCNRQHIISAVAGTDVVAVVGIISIIVIITIIASIARREIIWIGIRVGIISTIIIVVIDIAIGIR